MSSSRRDRRIRTAGLLLSWAVLLPACGARTGLDPDAGSGSTVNRVACGDGACAVPDDGCFSCQGGVVCAAADGTPAAACTDAGGPTTVRHRALCDGPEDCPETESCMPVPIAEPTRTECRAAPACIEQCDCPGGARVLCHGIEDCPACASGCVESTHASGYTYSICSATSE